MHRIVIDTNVLLHYPPITDIDWVAISRHSPIELVILMPVIHELDEKKSHALLGERAKRVLSKIQSIRTAGGIVRKNVTLRVDKSEGLTTQVAGREIRTDDKIVALAASMRSDEVSVSLATEDYGMQLKCEEFQLSCLEMPKETRLPDPKSEETRALHKAQTELARLQNRAPKLRMYLKSEHLEQRSDNVYRWNVPPQCNHDAQSIFDIRKMYPHMNQPVFNGSIYQLATNANASSIARYNSQLDSFYSEHAKYMKSLADYKNKRRQHLFFSAHLLNAGTATATDITCAIAFPSKGTRYLFNKIDFEEVYKEPKPPSPPKAPTSQFDTNKHIASILGLTVKRPTPDFPLLGLQAHPMTERVLTHLDVGLAGDRIPYIDARLRRLRHQDEHCLGDFVLRIDTSVRTTRIVMSYSIRDAETTDAAEGQCLIDVVRAE